MRWDGRFLEHRQETISRLGGECFNIVQNVDFALSQSRGQQSIHVKFPNLVKAQAATLWVYLSQISMWVRLSALPHTDYGGSKSAGNFSFADAAWAKKQVRMGNTLRH